MEFIKGPEDDKSGRPEPKPSRWDVLSRPRSEATLQPHATISHASISQDQLLHRGISQAISDDI